MVDFYVPDVDVEHLEDSVLLEEIENAALFEERDGLTDEQAAYQERLREEATRRMHPGEREEEAR